MFFSGGLIPTYIWVRTLGLINNPLVLILPGLAAYYLIIVRNFFSGMPQEIQEAAQIDGASDFALWWQIIMPLSKPILATIALWTAVNHWNAYLDALIYMTDRSKYVLQILLRRVLLDTDLLNMGMQPGQEMGSIVSRPTEETVKAALLIVTTVPILLVYPFAQTLLHPGPLAGVGEGLSCVKVRLRLRLSALAGSRWHAPRLGAEPVTKGGHDRTTIPWMPCPGRSHCASRCHSNWPIPSRRKTHEFRKALSSSVSDRCWLRRRRDPGGLRPAHAGAGSPSRRKNRPPHPRRSHPPRPCRDERPTASAAAKAPDPTKAPAPAARPKINYSMFVMSAQDPAANPDSTIQKDIMDRFNMDLNINWIERFQAKDVYATRFAAGDIPDAFHYEQTGTPLIEQGIVAEVPIATYKKNMPKYFKSLNDYSIMAWLGANYKGKNYGLPLMGPNNLIPFTEGWRLDTLEKVGMHQAA